MTRPAGGDDFFKIRGYQVLPEEGSVAARQIIADFCQGTHPLSSLPAPSAYADPIKARQDVISHLQMALDTPPNPENKAKRWVVLEKLDALGTFAKKHPMLTAGFILAIIMAVGALYLTIQTFLGHSTISIFKAHPSLGAGVTFMLIYYSAYMINLCRRAAMKDDLEARVQTHQEFATQLMQSKELDLASLTQRLNAEIIQLGSYHLNTEEALRQQQTTYQQTYDQACAAQKRIEELQPGLQQLYLQFQKIPAMGLQVQQAIQRANVALGAQLAAPQMTTPAEVPLLFQFEIGPLPSSVTFPSSPTSTMQENQYKLVAWANKAGTFLRELPTTIKNNPGSTGLLVGGLVMCVLSGIAIYFYFHGTTNLYFFGSLSLTTIAPMAIYGLSLIYEGYNNATITALQKSLREIDEENTRKQASLADEQRRLAAIQEVSTATLDDFNQQWASFLAIETGRAAQNMAVLRSAQTVAETKAHCETLLRLYAPLLEDDTQHEEVLRILYEPASGAKLFAS